MLWGRTLEYKRRVLAYTPLLADMAHLESHLVNRSIGSATVFFLGQNAAATTSIASEKKVKAPKGAQRSC